jgi:hypothetical protein
LPSGFVRFCQLPSGFAAVALKQSRILKASQHNMHSKASTLRSVYTNIDFRVARHRDVDRPNYLEPILAVCRLVSCDTESKFCSFLSLRVKKPLVQGCQMVCFQTKNPNLGKFWRAL